MVNWRIFALIFVYFLLNSELGIQMPCDITASCKGTCATCHTECILFPECVPAASGGWQIFIESIHRWFLQAWFLLIEIWLEVLWLPDTCRFSFLFCFIFFFPILRYDQHITLYSFQVHSMVI